MITLFEAFVMGILYGIGLMGCLRLYEIYLEMSRRRRT